MVLDRSVMNSRCWMDELLKDGQRWSPTQTVLIILDRCGSQILRFAILVNNCKNRVQEMALLHILVDIIMVANTDDKWGMITCE